MTSAAWHPDPTGRHELRYWDGSAWTDHVSDNGVQSTSPMDGGGQPQQQGGQPQQQGGQPAQQYGQQPAQQGFGGNQPLGGDAFAGISGELIDGRFSEVDGSGPQLQNKKMLRVRITEPFQAKQGAMVAYQGNVNFHYQSQGAARVLKRALTGEGLQLMRVEGQGDVFLADTAKYVHILHLTQSGISINGSNVLAFGGQVEHNIERVKGGSIAAGGLFNTTIRGTGWVAITTEGEPVVLNAGEAPTFADTDAIVAWSAHLQTGIRSTVSAGALIGRGSGEAFQVTFQGQGFVIVQPSEGYPVPTA